MADNLNLNKKENNFQNFIQFQKKILDSIPKNNVKFHYNNQPLALLTLDELFEFLEAHFSEFYESTNFEAVVPFIQRGIEEWSKNCDNSSSDIGLTLFFLLEKHTDDENGIPVVVNIIKAILNCLKSMEHNKDVKLSRKVFMQLAEILPTIENGRLVSEIASCLKIYMEMYPDNQHDIIKSIWSDLSQTLVSKTPNTVSTEIYIFINFYDEFYQINSNIFEDTNIIAITQQLLKSEKIENRKSGFYLYRKMIENLVMKLKKLTSFVQTSYNNQQIEELWTSYINIFETLEVEQVDAMKPTLENLKKIVQSKQLQTSWLEILYIRLLKNSNIDIMYLAMNFFLTTFSYSDLSADVIGRLLKVSNSMLLYNHEGHYLDTELFTNFLKGNLTNLFELMGYIEWKSIPLYIWIKAIYDNKKEVTPLSITFEQLLKLASKVYDLDSLIMRCEITKIFKELFKQIINNMSMKEYVEYVETLYTNTSNFYNDFRTFYSKMSYLETDDVKHIFSQRFYEIFVKNLPNTDIEVNEFVKFLNDLPSKQLGWLKFVPYHYFGNINDENIQKLNILYGINISSLKTSKLTEIITKFEQYLLPYLLPSDDNLDEFFIHSRLAAIAFYIEQKDTFDQEDNETFKILFNADISEYNNMIKLPKLWKKLCLCLHRTNKTLETWIIDEFLKRICDNTVGELVLHYLSKTYDENTKNKYFEIILDKYPHIFNNCLDFYVNPLKLSNQSRFFDNDLVKDEFRIEQMFCYDQFEIYDVKPISYLKAIWQAGLNKYCDEAYILYLLNFHKELSAKKSMYDENSIEHLIKLRIALAIYRSPLKTIITTKILDEIWYILINEYNQLNVCYLYELILSLYDTRVDMILEKLKICHSLTATQQISVISVVYTYCRRKSLRKSGTGEAVITHLISLLMCIHSETRMLAQIVLYKLLKTENFKNILRREQILQSLEIAMGTKLNENLNDIRLHMHELSKTRHRVILFVTKAPFDPIFYVHYSHFLNSTKFFAKIDNTSKIGLEVKDQIIRCQQTFLKKCHDIK